MSDTFKAAVLTRLGEPLEIVDLRFPLLGFGQVLVKVFYSTICASQINEVSGARGFDPYLPHLLGHEGYGVVVEVGKGVTNFRAGDEVIMTWIEQSGLNCDSIKLSDARGRLFNAGKVTTFCEYSVVSENRLFKAPKFEISQTLPLLGCAAMTGAGIVLGRKKQVERSLVMGAGGVGFFSVLSLRSIAGSKVHVIERNQARRALINRLFPGIVVYQSVKDDELIEELNSNGKFDEVFECTGEIDSLQSAVELTSDMGSLGFVSHPPRGQSLKIDPHDLLKGKHIWGSWGGGCKNPDLRDSVIELVSKTQAILLDVISKPISLLSINEAFAYAKKGESIRVLLQM